MLVWIFQPQNETKKPNSASVQAVQAVTASLIGWLSWRANTETSDRKLFHTRRSSSVWCFQLQQKFTHICLFIFQTQRRGCLLSAVLYPRCNSAANRSDSGLLTANAARKTSPRLLHPLSSRWGRSHSSSCPSSCQVTSQIRVEGRDFITGQSSCSSSLKMSPTLCSLSLRLLLGASQLLPVCTSFPSSPQFSAVYHPPQLNIWQGRLPFGERCPSVKSLSTKDLF